MLDALGVWNLVRPCLDVPKRSRKFVWKDFVGKGSQTGRPVAFPPNASRRK